MTEQSSLIEAAPNDVGKLEFEPIKGYPMLYWKGKRPFTSTQYYPAQLKETYGSEVNGWRNRIYWGDNLQVMSHLLKEFRGKIDLIYIDPPFDSKADYKKKIHLRGQSITNDQNAFEEKQYTDIWTNDEYLQFMYERLILMRELMADDATIYLHCDWNKCGHLKLLLDEVFGISHFLNQIVWKRSTPRGNSSRRYPEICDFLLLYTKSEAYTWHNQFTEYRPEYTEKYYNYIDENSGRRFQPTSLLGHDGVNPVYEWKGLNKPWRYPKYRLDELETNGLIYFPRDGGVPRLKRFLDEQKGIPVQSLWDDIPPVNSQAKDDTGYPTQKPEPLLERVIKSCTNPHGLVFDCFMGSGTAQAVATKLGRRFIGADINLGAIQITTKRLISIAEALGPERKKLIDEGETSKYTGFEVHNVNHYEVFRNPVQAKDLLIEALEVQPLPASLIYDGEKDGRLVKIMPVNRLATRADLNELIANFDYKSFERKHNENPHKPVEKLLLVCMGHEPDLAAHLQKEVLPFKIDVEVVDILRDRSKLEFKRDSEAKILTTETEMVIETFYPMNLLQKLSLFKENVEDWRELVESVMIDFNYDGAIFQPTLLDIPEKNELVKGKYEIPADAGNIRVKITDLLSESLEVDA